ncbi:hypothetical protein PV783_12515 [Chitinophaga sp. CC14]|uniref:hypothetical protein n=1 Tax=Chitinophaga sp. CC14 TaxID=3029199 RepID=UPI003B7BE42C
MRFLFIKPSLVSLIGIFVLLAVHSGAQTVSNYFAPTVFPKSPTAASIDKYGDYPVNQFSGIPDISISLYEITAGAFKVPITLSYHAAGFKVNEKAGWAGLGWTVFAGGQITRKIMGRADEDLFGYLQGKLQSAANVDATTNAGIMFLGSVRRKEYDVQPDIFSYVCNNHSGKFFFDGTDNYKVAMIPFSPVVITPDSKNLSYFTMKDENGNNFLFGNTAKESTSNSNGGISLSNTSAWLLDNMISQSKRDTVSFKYNTATTSEIPDFTHTWTVVDNVYNYDNAHPAFSPSATMQSQINNTSTIFQRTLQEINYRDGKVVFESATTPREDYRAGSNALNAIRVYSYDYSSAQFKLLKSIQFYTSYFINGTDVMSKRLKLDSLAIIAGNGDILEKYRFEYNTDKVLPAYTSASKDYWGYYNGKPNSTLIPQMTVPYNLSTITIGSSTLDGRECDNEYMQACVLKKISFPTGGYSAFIYEANRYQLNGAFKLAGGLRVKSITSSAGYRSKPITKTYNYLTARPNFTLKNYYFSTFQTGRAFLLHVDGIICPVLAGTRNITTYVSSPVIDIEPFDAIPVAYSDVTEYMGNELNNIGRIDYHYSDRPDALQTASLTGTPIINSYFYARGQLLRKSQYVNTGSSYNKVQEDVYTYSAFPEKQYNNVGFVVGKTIISDESSGGTYTSDVSLGERNPNGACGDYHDSYSYTYSYYSISSDDNYPISRTSTSYDSDDQTKSVAVSENYYYDNIKHQQVTRTTTIDSKGNVATESRKYVADFLTGAALQTGNAVMDTMLARNMQAAVVEKVSNVAGTEGISGNVTTDAQLTTYKAISNKAIVMDKHMELLLEEPITNFVPAGISSGQMSTDSRYSTLASMDSYDNNTNLLQYTSRNAGPVSIIWDYGAKMAVAEVKNAAITDVAYTSFEADGKGNWNFIGTPVNDNTAPTGKRAYNLSSGALTANGLSTGNIHIITYWSKSGAATISGTTASVGSVNNGWTFYEHKVPAGTASIQVSGAVIIDELRLYPDKAQITTYTYDPNIGVTSICSPLGAIVYYEYDSGGRLLLKRDAFRNIIESYEYHQKN